jgi:hypothetical protein
VTVSRATSGAAVVLANWLIVVGDTSSNGGGTKYRA